MNEFVQHTTDYWTSGGALLAPLALVCMGIWGYFLRSRDRMARVVREAKRLEPDLARRGLHPLPARGPLAPWLDRVTRDIRAGTSPRAAFHLRGDEWLDTLRRDIVLLGALTAVAPLLGLLGTVRGMIATFAAVSQVAGDTGTDVASGISQALITTQFGLVVALPGVFGVSRLRSMLREVEAGLGALRAAALTHPHAILKPAPPS